MLGYEPPQPKLWKAVLAAGIPTFPILYLLDVAIMHHRPGWIYAAIASGITLLLGYQMYSGGPQSLGPINFGTGSRFLGGGSRMDGKAASLVPRSERKQQDD